MSANAVARVTTVTAHKYRPATAPAGRAAPAARGASVPDLSPNLTLAVYDDFAAVEAEWRRFEQAGECTAFQTFGWLSCWQKHVGGPAGVRPAIAVARFGDGETAVILPLGVASKHSLRRLCWLGEGLCDYHAPLLARGFSQRVTPAGFLALWRELCAHLRRDPRTRFDWIELEKMPETVGAEPNPLIRLRVMLNASGAHAMRLGDEWETFYRSKRSPATRRRDRTKRKHMQECGEVRYLTAEDGLDAWCTLQTLMQQKSRSFARKGIPDVFAPAGHREFFIDLAGDASLRDFVHVSRVEIGGKTAAANLGVIFGDCYYHVLASYDEDSAYSRYGPGALHLRELMAYAIARGLKRFDFTIGDEPYKLEWSDTELILYDHVAAAGWRGFAATRVAALRRRIKRFLKQTPWAWRAVCRCRAVCAIGTPANRRSPAP